MQVRFLGCGVVKYAVATAIEAGKDRKLKALELSWRKRHSLEMEDSLNFLTGLKPRFMYVLLSCVFVPMCV